MGTVSKNFDYKEFEETDVPGLQIKNTIASVEVRDSVKALVDTVIQPLRDAWGKPIAVNSGYRCPEVNKAVNGEPTSQHLMGEAADVCPFGRNGHGDIEVVKDLARLARDLKLPFDQMILYPSFVHFSHKLHGEQRGQILYNRRYTGEKI